MQIFLSHSSRQKPLVREIRKTLPEHLSAWIDEQKLFFGDSVPTSIETAIKSDTDYVLLFLDDHAAASSWVHKEVEWALQAEKMHNRTILLPILIDETALPKIANIEFQNRKYLRLKDYFESSVRALSENISSELFALICRDISNLRNPKIKAPHVTIADADALLSRHAAMIQKAVFPHRKTNPISTEKLRELLKSVGEVEIGEDQFEAMLTAIVQRNIIPGLIYDGFELFLAEEHAQWKSEVQHDKKERIGRKVASYIKNGTRLFLDAGSTTEEIIRVVCKKIENRALNKITIGTTSIKIADMVSNCCVRMGFDDDFSAIRLYIPGGQVRPNTQAIVPAFDSTSRQIVSLAEKIGGFDIGVIGVNGVDVDTGFSTHANAEAENKADIISSSKSRIIVGDSSKIGLKLDYRFAHFSDEIVFVVDDDASNEKLQSLLKTYQSKIVLA